jgi:hypothetical protein
LPPVIGFSLPILIGITLSDMDVWRKFILQI